VTLWLRARRLPVAARFAGRPFLVAPDGPAAALARAFSRPERFWGAATFLPTLVARLPLAFFGWLGGLLCCADFGPARLLRFGHASAHGRASLRSLAFRLSITRLGIR
jgi:hypothetical protein